MLIIMILVGALSGWLCLPLCKKLIDSRTDTPIQKWYITGKYAPILWCALGAVAFILVELQGISVPQKVEFIIVTLTCLLIGSVDIAVKKIPNILLLTLIITKALFLAIKFSKESLIQSFWGFVAASVIFILPSLLKIKVGAGDIKLAAVIGLYLGINGFLQAMLIMAITISVYGIFLMIRKLGNFKSLTAMGPYLALGFIITLLFPII